MCVCPISLFPTPFLPLPKSAFVGRNSNKSQESPTVRARCGRGEMEIITAPPIPLCTFYCPFSNRKTAAEKNEGDKLYGGGEGESSSLLASSEHSPSLPLDGQFLFPFPLRRHSRVNSSPPSPPDQLDRAGAAELTDVDTSLAQNRRNSQRI